MTDNLLYAKSILEAEGCTLVLFNGVTTVKSTSRGVAFLLELAENAADPSAPDNNKGGRLCAPAGGAHNAAEKPYGGFSAADKVVGKGAAFLYVLLGVDAVYAHVMSVVAKEVLVKHGIAVFCDNCPADIINRGGTGPCPIEEAVMNIDDPQIALGAIKEKLLSLLPS